MNENLKVDFMADRQFEAIERKNVPEMDAILGKPFPVLNDGFVRVVDYMGSDETIVQAARVSYGKGTKKVREDRNLIRYLLRHWHTSPFEMCEIMLHVRVPMDCWRQWIRHRTANVNEYSTRYSLAIDATQTTLPGQWRLQSINNRQGSSGVVDESLGKELTEEELALHKAARKAYNKRIELGIAREQARKDLPLCTYTEAYWKIDLNNLLHFLMLRTEAHAQLEIRQYATTIGEEIVKRWVPLVWEAFQDYIMDSVTFSKDEQSILSALVGDGPDAAKKLAENLGWLRNKNGKLLMHYERTEFETKLLQMSFTIPW